MTDLLALADRVEKLEWPSVGMNVEIAKAIGWTENLALVTLGWDSPDGQTYRSMPPNFTGSLDAAMTLVPKGWAVDFARGFDDDGEFWSQTILIDSFSIKRGCESQDRREVMSSGPGDLPCRVVAACLRARASTDKGAA